MVTYKEIDALVRRHRRIVVCLVVRAQGSVPRKVGSRMVVLPNGRTQGTVGGGLFESLVRADALAALTNGQSVVKKYDFREVGASPEAFGAVCGGWAELFLEVVDPPDQLLIVGGGHCGRALAEAALLLGDFEITLMDDRSEFAEETGWPEGTSVVRAAPDFCDLPGRIGDRTFVVLVSRGAGTDEQALRKVIETEPAYIGMLGSRRKVRIVLDHLRAEGVSAERLARVYAPIGLSLGAETPAEIAISILAQIIAVRAGAALGTGK